MGYQTKVDWCNSTWNPVTGCLHGCEYCYARRIAERFAGCDRDSTYNLYHQATWKRCNPGSSLQDAIFEVYKKCPPINLRFDAKKQKRISSVAPYPWGFCPTFREDKLDVPQHWKKPRNIFVVSMGDLFGDWVPDEWIQQVFDACDKAPQHRYLFLTKNPARYKKLPALAPDNRAELWLGHSYTGIGDYQEAVLYSAKRKFVSVEPLLRELPEAVMQGIAAFNDWIIIGAETGNRREKIIPEKSWVDGIVYHAKKACIPVFMKESLRDIMGDDFRQEFPWEGGQK